MTVQGVKALVVAVRHAKRKSAKGLSKGLLRGGLFLQRESQKLVPIDTGDLRRSAATRKEGAGFDVSVVVSYSTEYALYVHENLEARHVPGKQAKFLEQPLREKRKRISAIITESIKGDVL